MNKNSYISKRNQEKIRLLLEQLLLMVKPQIAIVFVCLFFFLSCQKSDEQDFDSIKSQVALIDKIKNYSSIDSIIKNTLNTKIEISLSKGNKVVIDDCLVPLMKIDCDGYLVCDGEISTVRIPYSCLEDDYKPVISVRNNLLFIDQYETGLRINADAAVGEPQLMAVLDNGSHFHFIFTDFSDIQVEKNGDIYTEELKQRWKDRFLYIAYSSIDDGCPINTKEHFIASAMLGFNSLKTDMRLTKDNQIVLCHDPGFTLDKNGRIINYDSSNHVLIHDMNYDDVIKLEHAHSGFYKKNGYYAHPIGLDTYLEICKEFDIIPYITIRNEYVEETISTLMTSLKLYGLTNHSIINNYPPKASTCKQIRDSHLYIPICYTISEQQPIIKDIITYVQSLGNSYLCLNVDNLSKTDYQLWNTISMEKVQMLVYGVSNSIQYDLAFAYNCFGAQITRRAGFKLLK